MTDNLDIEMKFGRENADENGYFVNEKFHEMLIKSLREVTGGEIVTTYEFIAYVCVLAINRLEHGIFPMPDLMKATNHLYGHPGYITSELDKVINQLFDITKSLRG